MNVPLQTTLADAVQLLEAQGIPYALIGGLAASFRGQARVTADVDMVLSAGVDRALQLAAELTNTKFKPLFRGVEEVVQQAFILPLEHRTTNVKLDLSLGLSGFEQQAVARAQRVDLAGTKVAVVTAEDLLIMKVMAGRPQDDQDVRGLVLAHGDRLDWDYCRKVAAELGEALGQDLVGRVAAAQAGDL
jgi:predicted nucleotidyltransferase